MHQMVVNPLQALAAPRSVWVFSGFPPSLAFNLLARRSVLYVHDLFLIERTADLNGAGRYYMAPSFRAALRCFRWFLANSAATADRLGRYVGPEASVRLYRPPARDTLGLAKLERGAPRASDPLRIGMIGTIEPRKNYPAALALRAALAARLGRAVELHVVGRTGWGPDASLLARDADVHLHGFVDDRSVVDLVAKWDVFLSTSHDEGLGLPLLEVQHAGLPIVAPDLPVFREVLADSATFIDPAEPDRSADLVAEHLQHPDIRTRSRDAGRRNIERWNVLAAADHEHVITFLSALLAGTGES